MNVRYRIAGTDGSENRVYEHNFEGWAPRKGEHVQFWDVRMDAATRERIGIAEEICWNPAFVVVNVITEPQKQLITVWVQEV